MNNKLLDYKRKEFFMEYSEKLNVSLIKNSNQIKGEFDVIANGCYIGYTFDRCWYDIPGYNCFCEQIIRNYEPESSLTKEAKTKQIESFLNIDYHLGAGSVYLIRKHIIKEMDEKSHDAGRGDKITIGFKVKSEEDIIDFFDHSAYEKACEEMDELMSRNINHGDNVFDISMFHPILDQKIDEILNYMLSINVIDLYSGTDNKFSEIRVTGDKSTISNLIKTFDELYINHGESLNKLGLKTSLFIEISNKFNEKTNTRDSNEI